MTAETFSESMMRVPTLNLQHETKGIQSFYNPGDRQQPMISTCDVSICTKTRAQKFTTTRDLATAVICKKKRLKAIFTKV
jgi:hypothetical protein